MKICELKQVQTGIYEVQKPVDCPEKLRTDKGVLLAPFKEYEQKEQYNFFDYESQQYHTSTQQANVLFLQKLFSQDWKVKYVTIDEKGNLQLFRPIRLVVAIIDTIKKGVWSEKASDLITQNTPYFQINNNYEFDFNGGLFEIYLIEFDSQDDEATATAYATANAASGTKLEYFQQL